MFKRRCVHLRLMLREGHVAFRGRLIRMLIRMKYQKGKKHPYCEKPASPTRMPPRAMLVTRCRTEPCATPRRQLACRLAPCSLRAVALYTISPQSSIKKTSFLSLVWRNMVCNACRNAKKLLRNRYRYIKINTDEEFDVK